MYYESEDTPQNKRLADKWWKKAAKQNFTAAQNGLGILYYNGKGGLPQDKKAAAQWFQKATDQGDASAQYNLGVLYDNGEGVAPNKEKAAELYQKTADQGDANAQCNLARMYERGKGVTQNKCVAPYWYQQAAEQSFIGKVGDGIMRHGLALAAVSLLILFAAAVWLLCAFGSHPDARLYAGAMSRAAVFLGTHVAAVFVFISALMALVCAVISLRRAPEPEKRLAKISLAACTMWICILIIAVARLSLDPLSIPPYDIAELLHSFATLPLAAHLLPLTSVYIFRLLPQAGMAFLRGLPKFNSDPAYDFFSHTPHSHQNGSISMEYLKEIIPPRKKDFLI